MTHALGPKNQGSMSLAAIISVTMIGLGFFYVSQTSKQTRQAVSVALNERARELGQSSNLSSLAILRSLMTQSKLPNLAAYEPALYAKNYFDSEWNLIKNSNFALPSVGTKDRRVTIRSFAPGETKMSDVVPIFDQSRSQASTLNDAETLEIVGVNRSRTYLEMVESIDVKASRMMAVDAQNNKVKPVVTYGRIALSAPVPQGLTLKIKNANESSFHENFGTPEKPLEPGKYILQVSGKGVILNATVDVGGKHFSLVPAKRFGNITSESIIGQTPPIDLSALNPAGAPEHVVKEGCSLDVANEIHPGIAPASIQVIAKLYGVDEKEASGITARRSIMVGKMPLPAAAGHEGEAACQNACPIADFNKVYGTEEKFASGLDRALNSGKGGSDTFESTKTVEINNKKGRGIVCSNYELTAQQMKNRTGMNPSALMRSNPALYRQELDAALSLKQYVSYMAPDCKREVIGLRNSCGCFAADTSIQMADGSSKAASAIRAGDMVMNPKTQKAQMVRKVIAGPERWPFLEIRSGGKTLTVTGEHPFLTREGIKPAYRLTDRDVIIDGQEESPVQAVVAQERKEGEALPDAWNFELVGSSDPDDHYVLANGVMTGDLYLQIKINGRPTARAVVSEK